MKIKLSADELNFIAGAITWTLYVPFDRSTSPDFSIDERARLQATFDSICRFRHGAGSNIDATIDEAEFVVEKCTLAGNQEEVRHIINCLRAFYTEIGHSPTEVLAVTGMAISQLDTLLERLSGLFP